MTSHLTTKSIKASRFAVSIIFFVNGTGFASWVPHIPAIQNKFSLSESALGLCLLSIAAGALISMPITGWLISRFGSRVILRFISVIYCLVLPLMVATSLLPFFILSLFLFGASNGSMDVAMNAHGVMVEKKLGKTIMSSFHGLFSLGGLVGASLAGIMLSVGFTPTQHVLMMSVLLLILLIVVLPNLLPKQQELVEMQESQGPIFVRPKGPLLSLGLIAFFILMVEGAMADWTAIYISDLPQTTNALAAAGFAAFSLTMAIGRLTGDFVIRRIGKSMVVRYGILISASGLLISSLTSSPLLAIIGFAMVGIGLSNVIPVIFGSAGNIPGVESGKGIAAVTTSGYTGFLVGPPLIGFTADMITLSGSFLLLAGCFLIVSLFAKVVEQNASPLKVKARDY